MLYRKKIITPDQAATLVKDNDNILLNHGAAAPDEFIKALLKRHADLRNVTLAHLRIEGTLGYLTDDYDDAFFHKAFMVSPDARDALRQGRADFVSNSLTTIPGFFEEGQYPLDICAMQVSEPDDEGYCSYGLTVSYMPAAVSCARTVIAEINKQCPYTYGSQIHLSEIDYLIEADYAPTETILPRAEELERKIAAYIAEMIEDGSTIQLGIGGIPNAIVDGLKNHKNLGVHTELIGDGMVELIKAGVITNTQRSYHPGKSTATFIRGSKDTYNFVHRNPDIELLPVLETNAPAIVAQQSNFVGVNGAVEVDVTGQICAESIGSQQISGPGGQLDFALGAHMGKGGKFIIALPSTAGKGKFSRIVPTLAEGSGVTTPRALADYVVTEYGAASLRGKTLAERARALVDIAHPAFREEIEKKVGSRRDINKRFYRDI